MRAVEAQRQAGAFAIRVSMLFAAIFFVAGNHLPYMPVWLDWVGLSANEIAIVSAFPLFVRVVITPVIAFAADRAGDHRRFLIALAWCVLAALLLLAQMRSFWPILLCTLLVALAWTTIMPLTETIAVSGVRAAGLDYGRMRLWGSLSFIVATFCGGWIVERLGPQSAIWLIITGAAFLTAAAHALVQPLEMGRVKAATSAPKLRLGDAFALLRWRVFLLFLLAAGAVQAAHAAFYTFGTLHWRALGIATGIAGLLWSVGVVAEVSLFAYSTRVLRRLSPTQLIVLSAAAAVLRWSAMAFDPPLWALGPLQLLHALTFGGTHIGAIHFMARSVPERQSGTAQALYAVFTSGVILGATTLISGPLYALLGARAYGAMALIAAIGLVASLLLHHAWRPTAAAYPQS